MQIVQYNYECKSVTDAFDYSIVDDTDMVAPVKEATTKIHTCRRQAASSIIEIGEQLTAVKEWLGQGLFGKWVQAEFEWSERTARRSMRVAEVFGDKMGTLSDVEPTTLYLLSSHSTPEMIVGDSISKMVNGERLDHHKLLAQIQEARAKAAKARLTSRQRKNRVRTQHLQEQKKVAWDKKLDRTQEVKGRAIEILIDHLDREALKEFIASSASVRCASMSRSRPAPPHSDTRS